MGKASQIFKNCLSIGRSTFLISTVVLVGTGCNQVGFQISQGSKQQIDELCGINDTPSPTGPKITAPLRDKYVQPNITLEGSCDGTTDVKIQGGGINAPVTTACVAGQFSQALTLLSPDGLKDLNATQDGIQGTSRHCINLDTTPPRILITTPITPYVNTIFISVFGECEAGLDVNLEQTGGGRLTVKCPNGRFQAQFPSVGAEGPKTMIASQTDAAGNTGTDDEQYIVDTVAPLVRITTPAANAIVQNRADVTGTCETGLPVRLTGTAPLPAVTTTCDNGQFAAAITINPREAVLYIVAEQTDAAGNRGWDQRNVIRDTTPPMITLTSPAANTVARTGLTIGGACTDGLVVNISGTGVDAPSTAICTSGAYSTAITFSTGDGVKNVIASQTDLAGNVGSANRNFLRDNTPPAITIASPAAGTATRSTLALNGTCETGLQVSLTGAITAATAACANGQFNATVTLTAPDGVKNVIASQTDGAGNTGSANRDFELRTAAPVITITGPAAGTVAQTGVTVVGTCTTGLAINVSGGITSPSTAVCNSGQFSFPAVFSNGEGTKNIVVAQTDAVGNTGSANRDFVKDTTPPMITITAPAALTVAQTGVTLQGACTDGLAVQISGTGVAATSTATCTNGLYSTPVSFSAGEGTKNVVASQTDAAGNTGSANRDFVRNNTPPDVKITAPQPDTATKGQLVLLGTCKAGLPVEISGAITSPLTVQCNIGTFSGTITLTGSDGSKNVVATQTDTAGNVGSDNRNFLLDTTAPLIAITGPAVGTVAQNGVTVTGTCETGLQVSLTGAITPISIACANGQFSSAVTFTNGDGAKTVVASQTDAAGNIGSANREFVKDTQGPDIRITAPAPMTAAQTGVTLAGTCTNGLPVQISGTGVNAPSTTACANGLFSTPIAFSAGDGTKNVIASQTDSAGNVGTDNRNFERDTTAPAILITGPPAGTATRSTINVVGTCATGLPVNLTGAIVAPVNTACANGQFGATVTLATPDGSKTVTASQTDAVGNVGSDNRAFVLSTAAPLITITAPAANTVTRSAIALQGACTNGLVVNIAGAVSAPSTATCTNSQYSATVNLSSGDGVKNVTVAQTDAIGNSGSDNRNFVLDTTAPILTYTAPNAGTVAQTGVTVTGTCETGLQVSLSGGITATTTGCNNGQFSSPVTFSGGDGTKNVIASQTDAAGNMGSVNRDFIRDTTAPSITIVSPAAGTATRSAIDVAGTCETGLTVTMGGAIATPVSVNCAGGQFAATVTLASPDGSKIVSASQTDGIGNTGTASRSFMLTTAAPNITITAPAANTVTRSTIALQGACTNGLVVQIGGAVSAPSTATCTNSQYSATITLSSGDGVKNVAVAQTDAVGNSGSANRNFVLDTIAPTLTFTAPNAGTVAQTGVTVTGTCETGLQVSLSGGITATTTGCNNGQFSSPVTFSNGDGTKNVLASQTDAAGNTGTVNRDFIKDTTGPNIQITGPVAGTATRSTIDVVGTCETGLTVTMGGAIATPVSVNCAGGQFAATVTLASPDGSKIVSASQTDGIGNTGNASRSFVLTTAAPNITITAPAANTVTRSTIALQGACTNGLVVNIGGAISAPSTATCTNSQYSAIITLNSGDGVKNVTVAQTDALGNSGSANRNFVLDATAPVLTFTAPNAGTVAQSGVTVTGTCETGLQVSLSGGITATTTGCNNGQFSSPVTFSSGDGTKNVIASQTDAAGNTGRASRDFIRDTTAPAITIASPAAGTATRSTISLTGSCTDGLGINLSGDISPSMAVCLGGSWSAQVTLLPPDGAKNVIASQTDAAGNTGSASRSFNLITTAPSIRITAPAANTATRTNLTVSGTCVSGLQVSLTGAITATTTGCNNGQFASPVTFSTGDGTKNVIAAQTDTAGNVGSDNRNFILDTTAPLVRFSTPAAGTPVGAQVAVTGTCETGLPVQLSGTGLGTAGPVSCTGGQFNANITLSAGDGSKNIVASQTDAAGNSGSDNRSFNKDTTAPVIRIATPAANAITTGGLTLTGSCETGLTITIAGTGLSGGPRTANCQNSQFSQVLELASPDGSKNITVAQTDAAGNTGSDNRNFILDTSGPRVTITSPTNGTQVSGSVVIQGQCEGGLALVLSGDITATSTTTCPTGGNYSVSVTVTNGNGSKQVTASQTDLAGNTGRARVNLVVTPKPNATETFLADAGEGKVDILFVDDNSVSMETEQAALGSKFPSFVAELTGLDWQAGITTTDCSTGPWGICGSLLNMTGTPSYILSPNVTGFDQVFNMTIQRPETPGCAAQGQCPSGLEEAMKAASTAIDKRNTNNAGFFRNDAALAIVVLTDEDEQSDGTLPTATKPQAVVNKVVAAFGPNKKFKSYAITILPGDAACLKQQQDQQNGIGFYGTYAVELARLTGGQAVSICAPDYSVTLRQIGQDLRKLTQAVSLSRTPIPSTVQVTFTPAQNITWTVSGNTILFSRAVSAGTKIDVYYEY